MTLYAVLVFVFDTFPVSLCKGKVKTKEKRQTKENKRAFGTLWPSALFACAIQEPATSAHHASRGGTRRRRPPPPLRARKPARPPPKLLFIPCAPIRASLISASCRASSARLIKAITHAVVLTMHTATCRKNGPHLHRRQAHLNRGRAPIETQIKNYKKARKRRLRHSLPR